ncbi:MAG: UDP-glucose 4-epimerase GalE [Fimbriimonadaceae bacterium]
MKVFVTGAAGYIGSVVAERLIEQGHSVVAFDNLQEGNRKAVHPEAFFVYGDICDRGALMAAFAAHRPDAVVHLAAMVVVDESVRDPGLHYRINFCGGINLLDAMVSFGCPTIVFSSTAAVYGEPDTVPISEDSAQIPVNPYGETKLQFEKALVWYRNAHGIRHVSLRYFNACGATRRYGESRRMETHIIPLLFEVALGQREKFRLFGSDYPTPDGTCVRDYVHVADIADAHIGALRKAESLGGAAFNLGSGTGYSNLEVVEAVRKVTGHPVPFEWAERRPGDPAALVASNAKAKSELGWQPSFTDLAAMIETAWAWRREHPHGYV